MPSNRQFWQGLEVYWRGEIIDISAHHGRGRYFTDYRCGQLVPIDPDFAPSLYGSKYEDHAAVASFAVKGRLRFRRNQIVLDPVEIHQLSPWETDKNDGFRNYMLKRTQAQRANGSLKSISD